jgi:hypothetical protein
MAEWTLEKAREWVLVFLRQHPEARPGGRGVVISSGQPPIGDPLDPVLMQAISWLIESGLVTGSQVTTFATEKRPFGFTNVCLTEHGLSLADQLALDTSDKGQ